MKKIILATIVLLFATFSMMSVQAKAGPKATAASKDIRTVSTKKWLVVFKELFAVRVCDMMQKQDRFKKALDAQKIDSKKCLVLVKQSYDRCVNEYKSKIPKDLSREDAREWGGKLGKCSGQDFFKTYVKKS